MRVWVKQLVEANARLMIHGLRVSCLFAAG